MFLLYHVQIFRICWKCYESKQKIFDSRCMLSYCQINSIVVEINSLSGIYPQWSEAIEFHVWWFREMQKWIRFQNNLNRFRVCLEIHQLKNKITYWINESGWIHRKYTVCKFRSNEFQSNIQKRWHDLSNL